MNRKEYFNEAAKTWDQMFYTPELASFLEKFVSMFGLKPGYNVLDIGTGTGVLIPFLLQVIGPSGSITAVDFAEKMVKISKAKHSNHKNVTVKLLDVEKDELPTASFDAVTCFGLFPHLENKEKVLKKLHQALKKGGILIIAHALSSEEIKTHHNRSSPPVAKDILPEKTEMKRILKHTGYNEIHIEDKPGYYLCSSKKR